MGLGCVRITLIPTTILTSIRLHSKISKWKIPTNRACFIVTKSDEPATRMPLACMVTLNTAIAQQGLVQARKWGNKPCLTDSRGRVGRRQLAGQLAGGISVY